MMIASKGISNARILPRRLPHARKYDIEMMFKQVLDKAAVYGSPKVSAPMPRPFQSEIANRNWIGLDKLSDCDNCLPPWTFIARFCFPPGKNSLGSSDGLLD